MIMPHIIPHVCSFPLRCLKIIILALLFCCEILSACVGLLEAVQFLSHILFFKYSQKTLSGVTLITERYLFPLPSASARSWHCCGWVPLNNFWSYTYMENWKWSQFQGSSTCLSSLWICILYLCSIHSVMKLCLHFLLQAFQCAIQNMSKGHTKLNSIVTIQLCIISLDII